jgi:hypothetical protein
MARPQCDTPLVDFVHLRKLCYLIIHANFYYDSITSFALQLSSCFELDFHPCFHFAGGKGLCFKCCKWGVKRWDFQLCFSFLMLQFCTSIVIFASNLTFIIAFILHMWGTCFINGECGFCFKCCEWGRVKRWDFQLCFSFLMLVLNFNCHLCFPFDFHSCFHFAHVRNMFH